MKSLLGDLWGPACFLLIALGLAAGSVSLIGLGVLVLAAGGVARLGARLALDQVRYTRIAPETRAFVGETLSMRLRLVNAKWLPLPWVELRDALPEAMPPTDVETHPSGMPGVVLFTRAASMRGREAIEWPVTMTALTRGFFRVGPARLRSSDLFGLFERDVTVRDDAHLVVYPRTYDLGEIGMPSARPFGERPGGQRLFEDPVRVVGVRDYIAGDPLKRVDWNATARVGRLQSRLYEPSRSQAIVIALNITTMEHTWQGFDPIVLERGVVVAASLARAAFEDHASIGLVANGSFPDADRPIRIGAGRRPDQLVRVLEALAMVARFTTSLLSEELERPGSALPAGATVVVVAALMPPELAATLRRLRSQGYGVQIVKTSAWEWGEEAAGLSIVEVEPAMRALEAQTQDEAMLTAARGGMREVLER